MISTRSQIISLIEQGLIRSENINEALKTTRVTPDTIAWRTFIDHLLLWLGGLAMAFSALFFIAYNWYDFGRFAKFGLVEMSIVLAVLAYWKLGAQSVAGKVSLLVATILLGVLLALYGQTYQTGADPWQLFFTWAMLMLPWAFVARFAAIWLVWIMLINLSIVLYYQTLRGAFWFIFSSDTGALWLLFIINTVALFAWEFLAKRLSWLSERWALRLLALGSGVPITWLALYAIFDYPGSIAWTGLVWIAWLVALAVIYRKIWPDLFMLAGVSMSAIVVTITYIARHLFDDWNAGSFLFLALLVIAMGAGAAVWLRNVHRELHT